MKAEADVAMAKNEWTTTNKKMNIADLDGVLVAFVQAAGVIVVGLSAVGRLVGGLLLLYIPYQQEVGVRAPCKGSSS